MPGVTLGPALGKVLGTALGEALSLGNELGATLGAASPSFVGFVGDRLGGGAGRAADSVFFGSG
jgi:hypothetical protein